MLAAKTIMEQGIHVEGINFFTGFCVEGHTHAIRANDKAKPKRNNSLWVAEQLGIKLHIVDVIEEYKDVLINPKHGYGANMNPCLDCKIFMVNKAKQWISGKRFRLHHHRRSDRSTADVATQSDDADHVPSNPAPTICCCGLCAPRICRQPCRNAKVGSIGKSCMILAGVRASRKWRWPSNSALMTMPSLRAAAVF